MYIIYRVENGIKSYLGYDILGYYWTANLEKAHRFENEQEVVSLTWIYNAIAITE